MYTVRLRCGALLTHECSTFVPPRGEQVPCRRHGYCEVFGHGVGQPERRPRPGPGRARRRTQEELLVWLRVHPVTNIDVLRRHRFSLRLIAAAQREGLLVVDFEEGTVVLG